jgi:hypothetical protein
MVAGAVAIHVTSAATSAMVLVISVTAHSTELAGPRTLLSRVLVVKGAAVQQAWHGQAAPTPASLRRPRSTDDDVAPPDRERRGHEASFANVSPVS